jgi:hypothetical protein
MLSGTRSIILTLSKFDNFIGLVNQRNRWKIKLDLPISLVELNKLDF